MVGDSEGPGQQTRTPLEGFEATEKLHEGLLSQILGLGSVTNSLYTECEYTREVHRIDFGEGGLISHEDLLDEACDRVAAAVEESLQKGERDVEALERDVRRATGRFVNERTRRRPMIVPVVMET